MWSRIASAPAAPEVGVAELHRRGREDVSRKVHPTEAILSGTITCFRGDPASLPTGAAAVEWWSLTCGTLCLVCRDIDVRQSRFKLLDRFCAQIEGVVSASVREIG